MCACREGASAVACGWSWVGIGVSGPGLCVSQGLTGARQYRWPWRAGQRVHPSCETCTYRPTVVSVKTAQTLSQGCWNLFLYICTFVVSVRLTDHSTVHLKLRLCILPGQLIIVPCENRLVGMCQRSARICREFGVHVPF